MSETQELHEQTVETGAFSEAEVGDGVLNGVVILGKHSQNGRIYPTSTMKEAREKYRGVGFFTDHPKKSDLKERGGVRSVHDIAGKVRNPRVVGDQLKGDVELLDAEPQKSFVTALAAQLPEKVGMSHRAQGRVRVKEDGTQVVESISAVDSVDLVTEPASTSGLFESIQREVLGDQLLDRGREALEEAGASEQLIAECPATHLRGIGEGETEDERLERAHQLLETVENALGGTSGGSGESRSTGEPELFERDPADLFDDGAQTYDPGKLGEVYRELRGW